MMKSYLSVLVVLVLIVSALPRDLEGNDLDLVMVIENIRHGIRAPLKVKYDPDWADQLGELLPQGYRQAYVLGKAMAEAYPSLIKNYSTSSMYIRATQLNRTIQSAVAHMAGMLGFGVGPNLTNEQIDLALPPYPISDDLTKNLTNNALPFNWQPLPVHSVNLQNDYLMYSYNSIICPNSDHFQDAQYSAPNYAQFTNAMNSTIQNFNNITGKYFDFSNITSAFNTLVTDYLVNKPFPSAYKNIIPLSEIWNNLTFIHDFIEFYKNFGSSQQVQLFSYYPLSQFLQWLNGFVTNTNRNLKYILLSGSDTFLMPILSALGIASHSCLYDNFFNISNNQYCQYPDYSASLNFELYQNTTTNTFYVQIVYNGVPFPYCDSQSTLCEFSTFAEKINDAIGDMTLQKYLDICGVQSVIIEDKEIFWHTMGYVFGGFSLLFAVGIVVVLYHKKKESVIIQRKMYLFSSITEMVK